MKHEGIVNGMLQEFRRGMVIICVLSQLKVPKYGYKLSADLSKRGFPVESNTLYPLLRRLEMQGLLESYWETGEGKPRKYYSITELGNKVYNAALTKWKETSSRFIQALEGDDDD